MRTPAHHDSHELHGATTVCQSNQFTAAVSLINFSILEQLPVVFVVRLQVHRILARPILDAISRRVRNSPMDSDRVDWFRGAEIDHGPLWMSVFRFAGEM